MTIALRDRAREAALAAERIAQLEQQGYTLEHHITGPTAHGPAALTIIARYRSDSDLF